MEFMAVFIWLLLLGKHWNMWSKHFLCVCVWLIKLYLQCLRFIPLVDFGKETTALWTAKSSSAPDITGFFWKEWPLKDFAVCPRPSLISCVTQGNSLAMLIWTPLKWGWPDLLHSLEELWWTHSKFSTNRKCYLLMICPLLLYSLK